MKIKKLKSYLGCYDIVLEKSKKILRIIYGGNGDLYWTAYDLNSETNKVIFEITQEDHELYKLFDELYESIKNHQIYKVDQNELDFCETETEKQKLYESVKKRNQDLPSYSNYDLLYKDGVISWHSDSTTYEDANVVNISKADEKIILEFILYNKDMADEDSIRFCNSGSRYKPFNLPFMNMFNQLQEYNPEISADEQGYQKKL